MTDRHHKDLALLSDLEPADVAALDYATFEVRPEDGPKATLVIERADGRLFASVINAHPDEKYNPLTVDAYVEMDITDTALEEVSILTLLRHTGARILRKATRGW